MLDISIHNKCLLMKHIHKFLNHANLPWVNPIWDSYYPNGTLTPRPVVSFWWKGILKLLPLFKLWTKGSVGRGNTICFWQDNWGHNILQHKYPELHSFCHKADLTVHEFLQMDNPMEHFHTPLSLPALHQFQELQYILQNTQLSDSHDSWNYSWGSAFSSIKLYKCLTESDHNPPVIFRKIWKNAAILRYKIFLWLILHDRVNSRGLLKWKSFHLPSYDCETCHLRTEESTLHLFWDCDFAHDCWISVLGQRKRGISIFDEIVLLSEAFPSSIATEILIMGCWRIWMQRNGNFFTA